MYKKKNAYDIGKHIGQFRLSTFHVEKTDGVGSADWQSIQLLKVAEQLFRIVHLQPRQRLWHARHTAHLQHSFTN